MSSFWWKEIQLIVNAWFCLEETWIHSKGLPSFFRDRDRDRDGMIKTVGITGLRGNFGRDGGIERPYWGHSEPDITMYQGTGRIT